MQGFRSAFCMDIKTKELTTDTKALQSTKQRELLNFENPDAIPSQLTNSEFEVLLVLLKKQDVMTTKGIERDIQLTYIVHALFEEIKRKHNSNPWTKFGIKIGALLPTSAEEIAVGVKKDFAETESDRKELVTAINNRRWYRIPSYNGVRGDLKRLLEMKLVKDVNRSQPSENVTVFWGLDQEFKDRWGTRKVQVYNELQNTPPAKLQNFLFKYDAKLRDFYLLVDKKKTIAPSSVYLRYVDLL